MAALAHANGLFDNLKGVEMYLMIWPERRYVSPKRIKIWFEDAIANQEIKYPEIPVSKVPTDEMVRALNDVGNVTINVIASPPRSKR